jgi:hypothetical protein
MLQARARGLASQVSEYDEGTVEETLDSRSPNTRIHQ